MSNGEKADATFYWAYCHTEEKQLGTKTADRQVALNTASHHERGNPDHRVTVEED